MVASESMQNCMTRDPTQNMGSDDTDASAEDYHLREDTFSSSSVRALPHLLYCSS